MVVDTVMLIRVVCKHCGVRVKVPDSARGRGCRCPKCRGVTRVPEDAPRPRKQTKAAPATFDGKFLRFYCHSCTTRNKVVPEAAAKWACCGKCGTVMRVPKLEKANGWEPVQQAGPAKSKTTKSTRPAAGAADRGIASRLGDNGKKDQGRSGGSVHGLLHFASEESLLGDETQTIGLDDAVDPANRSSRFFGQDSLANEPEFDSHVFPPTEEKPAPEDSLDLGIDDEPNKDDTVVAPKHRRKKSRRRRRARAEAEGNRAMVMVLGIGISAMTVLAIGGIIYFFFFMN